jgi:hypothetical protein
MIHFIQLKIKIAKTELEKTYNYRLIKLVLNEFPFLSKLKELCCFPVVNAISIDNK